MPGMGLVIDGAVQQAPQRGRQAKVEVLMDRIEKQAASIQAMGSLPGASTHGFLLTC
jgi:hypothetical protein